MCLKSAHAVHTHKIQGGQQKWHQVQSEASEAFVDVLSLSKTACKEVSASETTAEALRTGQ